MTDRKRTPLGFVVCVAVAVLVAAGCGGPYRIVEVPVGGNAQVYVDGDLYERDEDGRIEVTLRKAHRVRIEEPNKVPVVYTLDVLIDPMPSVEDSVMLASTANTTIVLTKPRGGSMTGTTEPVVLIPDPIEWLRDVGGPYFNPSGGQGIIVVASDHRAQLMVDGKTHALVPGEGATPQGGVSLPVTVVVDPGTHTVHVERVGCKPFESEVIVQANQYVFLAVRLAPERRAEDD